MSTVTDPIHSDDTCPSCGALDGVQLHPAPPTVEAWSCTTCDLDWAVTVVNPALRVALSVVGLLPTPQQRTAALLASCVPRSPNALRQGSTPLRTTAA